jgi:hypothetical protein
MSAITSDLSLGSRFGSFLDAPLRSEGTRTVLALSLAGGIAFDVGLRAGIVGVGGALAVLIASVALLASGRVENTQARLLVGAAPLFGVWLAIRTTPWLIPFDVIAVIALLLLGSALAGGGNLLDFGIPEAIARAVQAVVQAFFVPAFAIGALDAARVRGRRVVRGIALALPLVIVLAALFASADALFARAVHLNIGDAVWHAVAVGVGTTGMVWLMRLSSLRRIETPAASGPELAPVEWTIVLGALNLVLAGFAAAQIVALSSTGKHLLHTTYAQYARSGFFQLLAAVTITGLSLLALHATAERRRRGLFRALSFTAIALTMVVVVSAFHRLSLYEHAYGMTMLRLYVHIAIVGAGLLLAVLALRIGGIGSERPWFAPLAGVVLLATLFGLNVANPEAFVARYNLTHRSAHFDPSYLGNLTPDAAPALAGTKAICSITAHDTHGWAAFNVSRSRALALRKETCR